MSRARSLKPSFFKNETLAELDPLVRLFFQGLWCEADRRGVVEDRPKRLKAEIMPYDEIDPDDALSKLAERGFIERYEIAGTRCIFIVNFGKHQNPHRDEKASTLPAPCKHSVDTVPQQDENNTNTPLTLNPEPITGNIEPRTPPPPSVEGDAPDQKPKRVRSIKTPVPDDVGGLVPLEEWLAMGQEQGMTEAELEGETRRMVDHFRSNGERRVDWVATWRNWMRSPYRRPAQAAGSGSGRSSPLAFRPPLPDGITESLMNEYVMRRRAKLMVPDDWVSAVDKYIAALEGRPVA